LIISVTSRMATERAGESLLAPQGAGIPIFFDRELGSRMRGRVEHVRFLSVGLFLFVGLLFFFGCYWNWRRRVLPFEGELFGNVAHIMLALFAWQVLENLLRLIAFWADYRDVATQLEHPTPARLAVLFSSSVWERFRRPLATFVAEHELVALRDAFKAVANEAERDVMRQVLFVSYIRAHLRNLLWFITAGILLVLLTVNSYPFNIEHGLTVSAWLLLLLTLIASVIVLVQMNRDELMSLVSGTTPGQLTIDRPFVVGVLLHGVFPALVLIAARFPSLHSWLVTWLEPMARVLRG
jgi:hypothetical protein